MVRRIYYTAVDNGDGYARVEFFSNKECIRELEDLEPEYYRGEGGGYFDITGEITNIKIYDMEYVNQRRLDLGMEPDDISQKAKDAIKEYCIYGFAANIRDYYWDIRNIVENEPDCDIKTAILGFCEAGNETISARFAYPHIKSLVSDKNA